MNIQDKTKEELINELQELQQTHDALKVSYEADIIRKKQTIEALQVNMERFQLLFNKAPLGYQSLNFDGNFIDVNQQWLDTLGYKREEVIGKWFGNFLTPAYQVGFRERFPVFKAQGHIHSEFEMVHKNGSVLFIGFDGKIGYDLNGEFKQTYCILQDITARKRDENALRESEENLSITLQSIGDGVIATDITGCIVNMNPVAQKLCGWKLTDALGKPLHEVFKIINAETLETVADPVEKVMENGEAVGLANHTVLISKDGTEYQIADSAAPIKNKDGEIIGVVLVFSDVTEKYAAEVELTAQKQLYEQILEQSLAGYWDWDVPTGDEYMSPTFKKMFGYEDHEIENRAESWQNLIFAEDLPGVFERFNQHIESKGEIPFYNEVRYHHKNGSTVWVICTGKVIEWDDDGKAKRMIGCHIDITERRKIENELEEKTSFLLTIMETSPVGIVTVDKTGNITYANSRAEQILGLVKEEITSSTYDAPLWNHTDLDGSPFPDEKQPFNIVKESLKTVLNVQHGITWPDGTTVILSINASPIKDNKGNFNGMIASIEDISERKKAEEALRQSEEMMRSSQSVAHICSYSTNLNQNELEKSFWVCSPEFYNIFGIDKTYPHTIEGWMGLIHPDYREETAAYHESVVKEKGSFNREYKIIRINDGAERWVHGTGELEFDKNGKPVRMHGAIQDITGRKKAEEALRQSEELLQSILHSQRELICRYKPDTTITFVNHAYCKYFNHDQDQIIGKSWLNFIPENDKQKVDNKNIADYIFDYIERGPETQSFEQKIENPDDTIKWISWSNYKIRNEKNQLIEIQSVGNDITDKKEKEKLESEIEIANKSLRFKQNFLANMSHEIRTPLTGVIGITDILAQTELQPEQREYIATLKQSTENLHEIINQILDYSKIEAGKIELHPVSFATQTIFDHAVNLFYSANHKPIELKTEINENLPKQINADQLRIQQIISNLVSNALKFTQRGKIILRAAVHSLPGNHKIIIKIEVEDTGIGIDKTNIKHLFKPFSQIDNLDTRAFEGTGLGLSICKDLALLLKGDIGVESTSGKGSHFWFTFEADHSKETNDKTSQKEKKVSANNQMLRILLVEDKIVNQKVVGVMLTSQGHKVTYASHGKQAVEIFNPADFDMILMDIQMPVMDGITATEIIREKFGPQPLIVGLSANAFEGDKEKYMARGMNDYLTKPVKGTDFKKLVNNWFKELG